MPLKLVKPGRHGSPNYYIRGAVRGISVDESTGTSDPGAADAIRILREAEILKRSVHGDTATRTFAQGALSYMEAGGEAKHIAPLLKHFGDKTLLSEIGQGEIDAAARKIKPRGSPSTLNRCIYTPIAAILHHSARKRWCAKPVIARPVQPEGRVRWLTHEEAERLIASATDDLRPLVTFLLCTGVRITEALTLDWRNVDLSRCHASILNEGAGGSGTKNGESRGMPLHPRAVAALANLPHREGKVFRTHYGAVRANGTMRPVGPAYRSRKGKGGGQVKTAWPKMLKRAGVVDFTPHDCRHTWATWHYAANRDIAALMKLGGWSDVESVMRYTHVNVGHLAPSIARIWGEAGHKSGEQPMSLVPQSLGA
jgi:integrase